MNLKKFIIFIFLQAEALTASFLLLKGRNYFPDFRPPLKATFIMKKKFYGSFSTKFYFIFFKLIASNATKFRNNFRPLFAPFRGGIFQNPFEEQLLKLLYRNKEFLLNVLASITPSFKTE